MEAMSQTEEGEGKNEVQGSEGILKTPGNLKRCRVDAADNRKENKGSLQRNEREKCRRKCKLPRLYNESQKTGVELGEGTGCKGKGHGEDQI